MSQQLDLSSPEVELISELLKNAQKKLLVEIRHTDHRGFRDSLKERLVLVESISRKTEALAQSGCNGSLSG